MTLPEAVGYVVTALAWGTVGVAIVGFITLLVCAFMWAGHGPDDELVKK